MTQCRRTIQTFAPPAWVHEATAPSARPALSFASALHVIGEQWQRAKHATAFLAWEFAVCIRLHGLGEPHRKRVAARGVAQCRGAVGASAPAARCFETSAPRTRPGTHAAASMLQRIGTAGKRPIALGARVPSLVVGQNHLFFHTLGCGRRLCLPHRAATIMTVAGLDGAKRAITGLAQKVTSSIARRRAPRLGESIVVGLLQSGPLDRKSVV